MPKVTQSKKPVLVNRGPAGLLAKLKRPEGVDPEASLAKVPRGKVNDVAPALADLVVDIASLVPDPQNARLHPERNLQAIKDSLRSYGQVKPIVVRRKGSVVVAGNGTLEAAKALRWTKIAAVFVDMTPVQAAGYGIADNRTAELAAWDTEVLERLDRLLLEAGKPTIGWSADELAVLRKESWVEAPEAFPEVDESIEVEHVCPKCGYAFSGGETREKWSDEGGEA